MKATNSRCKLTGDVGPLVRSHIIPRALTNRYPENPHLQIAENARSSRRRESWYDHRLVTRQGEDILADYDAWAIDEMRRLKLVWSGWGPVISLRPDIPAGEHWGLREVSPSDPTRLRLFFLSVLWRAAASQLPEMSAINLKASDIRRLGRMVREGDPAPMTLFPITLSQISDRGPTHNMAPVARGKRGVKLGRYMSPDRRIFRFYFDGLIVQFDRDGSDEMLNSFGPMVVGQSKVLVISTVSYEASWQRTRMEAIYAATAAREPDRLFGYVSAKATFAGVGSSQVDMQPPVDLARFANFPFVELAAKLADKE